MAKRGRPKLDPEGSPSKYLTIRVAPGEHETYLEAADRAGETLSEWVRHRLNSAVKREAKRKASSGLVVDVWAEGKNSFTLKLTTP